MDHFQDTRHIAFGFDEDGPRYEPGDILTVWPRQDEGTIAKLLEYFDLNPRDMLTVGLQNQHQEMDSSAQVMTVGLSSKDAQRREVFPSLGGTQGKCRSVFLFTSIAAVKPLQQTFTIKPRVLVS